MTAIKRVKNSLFRDPHWMQVSHFQFVISVIKVEKWCFLRVDLLLACEVC